MEPIVRALDVGFGHTKFVLSVDGSEVRCAHFPSVAYPTESDETTDPMGGRRKTVGIPIDGLIYEVGPDVHLAADVFNAKQMHERYSETPEYLAMLRGALHYMKVERIDLLVVGLPVAAFKAKMRAALERLVLGRHDVGRGKTVQVERARVVPQPQGALMYYGHVHNRVAEIRKERSLIIDPAREPSTGWSRRGCSWWKRRATRSTVACSTCCRRSRAGSAGPRGRSSGSTTSSTPHCGAERPR
jgi:plasmid segregation protein ParM